MPEELIAANTKPWVQVLGGRLLAERALRGNFHRVWLHLEPAALAWRRTPPAERVPAIFTCTHTSWWDGYLTWPLNRALGGREAFMMMDEASLRHFRFFTWMGLYGVDRANPRAALRSIEYSADLLRAAPHRALWIFPQGAILPPDRRPLDLFPGVAHIARRVPLCDVVPIAWRLEYRYEQRAEIFVRVGAPIRVTAADGGGSRALTARIDAALTAEADRLHAALTDGDISRPLPGYVAIMRGRPSINRVWETVQAGARRLLGRPSLPPAP